MYTYIYFYKHIHSIYKTYNDIFVANMYNNPDYLHSELFPTSRFNLHVMYVVYYDYMVQRTSTLRLKNILMTCDFHLNIFNSYF